MVRTSLAFGDSIPWGTTPLEGGRHRYGDRWTTVVEQGLGAGLRVNPEGLGGRGTATDDLAAAFGRNGRARLADDAGRPLSA